jgi:diaminopimelate decarboxylase
MEPGFNLGLFPVTAAVNPAGHLAIGGCDLVQLAAEYGTPLYIFDEESLRRKCREYRADSNQYYSGTIVAYASKAYINKALAVLFREEGLWLDAVSGGELSIAQAAGFPAGNIYFHGNNKGTDELKLALQLGVGRIVVDNFFELERLDGLAKEQSIKPAILLRLTPGIDPHTHRKITTGNVDSKFGFPKEEWEPALRQAQSSANLNLLGLHAHIGSLIFEMRPYEETIAILLEFAADMKTRHGFDLKELNIGGGFAIQYVSASPAPPVKEYAAAISSCLKSECARLKLALPKLTVEPGRSIVGQAGIALYTVGAIKDIPGVRRYVAIDGGMADNIRPAIYGSQYEAAVANKATTRNQFKVTIAGKFCESGDILINDIQLPPVEPGDLIAVPDCGAYCLAMASNYNAFLKPAIVMVKDGQARLIRRRETYADLWRTDV